MFNYFTHQYSNKQRLNHFTVIHTLVLLVGTQSTLALQKPLDTISTIVKSIEKEATVGLIISDTQGRIYYQHNAHKYLVPASTQKVLTAMAAKHSLPEQAPFSTTLYHTGQIKNDAATGSLIITGQGDPSFTSEKLNQLLLPIADGSVRAITGDIILNDHAFDAQHYAPGTVWEELNDCYAGPTHALSMNHNCFTVQLAYDTVGQKFSLDNPCPWQPIKLDIQAQHSCLDRHIFENASTHHAIYTFGAVLDHNPFQTPQTLSGCWTIGHKPETFKLSISKPEHQVTAYLSSWLKTHHIKHFGKIRTQSLSRIPKQARLINTIHSDSLTTLLTAMLRSSDNHIANHLFKRLHSVTTRSRVRAAWSSSELILYDILYKMGLRPLKSSFGDGAGLSRNNRIQPRLMHRALLKLWNLQPQWGLIDLMASNKHSNSLLAERLGSLQVPIQAKTGTLKGVVGLVGFLDAKGPHPKIFTLIINGHKETHDQYHELERGLFEAIALL